MKIVDIKTICLKVPFPPGVVIKGAVETWYHRNGMFLLVETDEGVTGIGEIWCNCPQWSHYEKEITVHQGLKPYVIGLNPLDIDGTFAAVETKMKRLGSQWGAYGVMHHVLSGFDVALWDIKGKVTGKPICELLGSKADKPITVYCSGLGPKNVVANAEIMMNQGVTHFKMRMGMNETVDIQNLKELRNLLGDDRKIMVDANQGWTLDQALKMIKILKEYDVDWVEEPLVAGDIEGLEALRKQTDIKIASGENFYGYDFERHFQRGLIDICQADVTKCGGITEILRIAKSAKKNGIEMAPHFLGNGLGLASTLQIMNAIDALYLEYDSEKNPMIYDCVQGIPRMQEGGVIYAPEKSGLGVALNDEKIEEYRFIPYTIPFTQ